MFILSVDRRADGFKNVGNIRRSLSQRLACIIQN